MNTKGLNDLVVDNWKLVAGAVGVAALLLVGVGVWNESRKEKERVATNALYSAQKSARELAEQKKAPEAAAALNQVIETFPGTRAAYEAAVAAGDIFMDSGAYAEATKRYEAAAKLAHDAFSRVLAHYNAGIADESAGQFPQALAAYDDAMKVSGADFLKPELLLARARCFEALGQKPQAADAYREVEKNYGSNPYYSGAAAASLAQLGEKSAQ